LEPVFHGRYPERLFDEYVRLIGDDFLHEGDCEAMNAELGLLALKLLLAGARGRFAAGHPADQPIVVLGLVRPRGAATAGRRKDDHGLDH